MALPAPKLTLKPQSPPAIDQVWLIEVDENFTQAQLMSALASNSIELPQQEADEAFATRDRDQAQPADVGSIHVAANVKQMKNALAQLTQSDAVNISTYQLPEPPTSVRPELKKDSKELLAAKPLPKIALSRRAMAQHLRGSHFRRAAPLPSSRIPETFEKLEARMKPLAGGPTGNQLGQQVAGRLGNSPRFVDRSPAQRPGGTTSDNEQASIAASVGDDATPPAAPAVVMSELGDKPLEGSELSAMNELVTDKDFESGELKNFLILIRRTPVPLPSASEAELIPEN